MCIVFKTVTDFHKPIIMETKTGTNIMEIVAINIIHFSI